MIKNIIIIVLGYFVWLAYFDEAHSASQENQYCDIKTTIVKTVDKDGKTVNEESKEIVECDDGVSLFLLVFILIASVNFLTEITSNLATTAMLLPVLYPMAMTIDVHPFVLMVSATVAASCAFMLPVATPPNAVVFGSGYLRIPDMVRIGIWMNILSIILLTFFVYFVLPYIWDFNPLKYIIPSK